MRFSKLDGGRGQWFVVMKPEVQAIEEMQTRPIEKKLPVWLIAGAKENRGGEDTLEAFHDAVVSFSVLEEAEEIQHLGGRLEADGPASLAQRQGGHPNGNEAVLAKGDGRFIMHLPQ
jgi:hypothetical protein